MLKQSSIYKASKQKALEPYLSNHEQLLNDSCEILKEVESCLAPPL